MGINSIRRWNTSNKIQKTVIEKTTTKTRYAKLSGKMLICCHQVGKKHDLTLSSKTVSLKQEND